jgi:hypothetical protein
MKAGFFETPIESKNPPAVGEDEVGERSTTQETRYEE